MLISYCIVALLHYRILALKMSKKQYKKKRATTPNVAASTDKKRVIVTQSDSDKKRVVQKTVSRLGGRATVAKVQGTELLYGRINYILMAAGVGLMLLGYLMMTGGAQPNAETWDPNIIYNFRRVTLGPFLILAGIGVEIFAIFKQK